MTIRNKLTELDHLFILKVIDNNKGAVDNKGSAKKFSDIII